MFRYLMIILTLISTQNLSYFEYILLSGRITLEEVRDRKKTIIFN